MIPQYSSGALKVKSIFVRYRNEIDIYTEDKLTDKEFYKLLLQRLTQGNIKINDIFPLGPKSQVIKQCKEDHDSSRKKLYIVDGDLELINNSNTIIDNLYILDAYCIENFLIDEKAAIEVIWFFVDGLAREAIKSELRYNEWIESIKYPLIELFLHFSILRELTMPNKDLHHLSPEIKSVHDFLESQRGAACLSTDKVNLHKESCKTAIIECFSQMGHDHSIDLYEQAIDNKRQSWPVNEESLLKIVSGKVYLLPLLQFKISSLAKQKIINARSSIKKMLAAHCDLTKLQPLRAAIERALE